MPIFTRRRFLAAAASGVAATAVAAAGRRSASACVQTDTTPALPFSALAQDAGAEMGPRFLAWLRSEGVSPDREVKNLVFNFYDPKEKRGSWIYPMLSGKAVLWLLGQGLVDEASAVMRTLLRFQQTSRQGLLARSYGAFPSRIETDPPGVRIGNRFYSGDNLVILEALVALYEKTKQPELLNAAIGVGTWITEVMCKGQDAKVWVEDHGAPMHFVTATGDFSNAIYSSVELLWIGALSRLGRAASEPAYCRQAERAFQFLRGAQYGNGAFLDHYDPGYPPLPYDAGRWKPYQAKQVIADNLLRSALGLCRFGQIEAARKLYQWLKVENGAVPAYVDLETGGSGFPSGQPSYYDVTSSGLHRSLCQWLGERAAASSDIAFLKATQHPSGCWYWGLYKEKLMPVEPHLAPVVGFWATADLSTRVA